MRPPVFPHRRIWSHRVSLFRQESENMKEPVIELVKRIYVEPFQNRLMNDELKINIFQKHLTLDVKLLYVATQVRRVLGTTQLVQCMKVAAEMNFIVFGVDFNGEQRILTH
eukprot:PhF_6_TR29203/c1_g2_i6/m.42728